MHQFNKMGKVLLAGATGYLGNFILEELSKNKIETRAIIRDKRKLRVPMPVNAKLEYLTAELTDPQTIIDCCENIETVISTVGITRQKEGFTYMDVDYQANLNLLEEAKRSGVKKFIYVAVLNGNNMTELKICQAKEQFVSALTNSGLNYCIIRPNGYFSDMDEFFKMAERGRIYMFGDGRHKINPIHGADLAKVCIGALLLEEKEILVGGPQTLTHRQIAEIAFSVADKRCHITHIPNWVSKNILVLLRIFTNSRFYGPIEFFMTVLSMDLIAPEYGTHTLEKYFKKLKE